MKTIYLIRHSYAVKDYQGSDYDRPLKAKGIKVAEFIGNELKKKDICPEYILTSAAQRTVETTNILSEKVGFDKDKILTYRYLYDSNETKNLREINKIDNSVNNTFLVGHNPTISGMVSYLSGESPLVLSPGSVVAISFDFDDWGMVSFNTGKIIDKFLPRSYEELNSLF